MKAFDPEQHRVVLDAAMRLFEKHPLRDITLDKLAKASGVPAFDILRHFQSSENILRAVLERELEMMAASAQAPELRMPGETIEDELRDPKVAASGATTSISRRPPPCSWPLSLVP